MDDIDEFEKDVEEFEDDDKAKKAPAKKKKVVEEAVEETTERYVAFYQQPKIGIVDTLTNEIILELADYSIAQLEAFKLNKLDKIGIASGVQ